MTLVLTFPSGGTIKHPIPADATENRVRFVVTALTSAMEPDRLAIVEWSMTCS